MKLVRFIYRSVQNALGLTPKELYETSQETEERRQTELDAFLEEAKNAGRQEISFSVEYLPAEKNIAHDIYYRTAQVYLSFGERILLIRKLTDTVALPDKEPKRLERLVSEEEARISALAEENGLKLYGGK